MIPRYVSRVIDDHFFLLMWIGSCVVGTGIAKLLGGP